MHLRAIPRRHRQEIAGGPSPAGLALDTLHTVAAEALCRVIGLYGLNALHNKAGCLVLLDRDTAVRHHNCIFLQGGTAFCQNAREYKQLHTAGQILHGRKRHQRVGFRGHDLVPYDGADQCDILVVELLCILPQQLGDRAGGHLSDLTAVGVQRVAGQVQTGHLFFHLQQFGGGVFRQFRHLILIGRLFIAAAHQAEQIHLPIQILAGICLHTFQDALHAFKHPPPGRLQCIKSTRLDKIFQGTAV